MVYQGIPMTRVDCRDWSATTARIDPAVHPIWPVPDLNLLTNFHFSGNLSPWKNGRLGDDGDHHYLDDTVRHPIRQGRFVLVSQLRGLLPIRPDDLPGYPDFESEVGYSVRFCRCGGISWRRERHGKNIAQPD